MNSTNSPISLVVQKTIPPRIRHLFMMVRYFIRSDAFKHLEASRTDGLLKDQLREKLTVYETHISDLLYAEQNGYDVKKIAAQIKEFYTPQELQEVQGIYKKLIGS